MDKVDKRCSDDVMNLNASHSLDGCLVGEAVIASKVWLLAVGTTTTASGVEAQRGGASHWVEVDVYWPPIRSHSVLEVVLQVS